MSKDTDFFDDPDIEAHNPDKFNDPDAWKDELLNQIPLKSITKNDRTNRILSERIVALERKVSKQHELIDRIHTRILHHLDSAHGKKVKSILNSIQWEEL